MSLGHGSSIVRDGLVFYYDSANVQKSWNGAPATNLFTETNLINWTKTATVTLSSFTTPFGNPSYSVNDNNTSSYLRISRPITVANDSSSYTLGLFVRKTYGATSARLGFNSGFNTGGTTVAYNQRFNSDTGVATHGTVIDYGDWWYWYFTITNNGTGNTNLYCDFYPATGPYNSSDAVTATGTAIIGEMMLVAGSTAVRFVNGTRSSTQAILDMTNTRTITSTNLTYASNNTFSFDGSTSYLTTPYTQTLPNNFTVEAWVYPTQHSSDTNIGNIILMCYGGYNGWIFSLRGTTSTLQLSHHNFNISATSYNVEYGTGLSLNTWYHVAATDDGTTVRLYVNGSQVASGSSAVSTTNGTMTLNIGAWPGASNVYFKGQIPVSKIYTKALSALEIAQNFNALRGRYGI